MPNDFWSNFKFDNGPVKTPKAEKPKEFDFSKFQFVDSADEPSPSESARGRRTMAPVTGSEQGDQLRRDFIAAGNMPEEADKAGIGRPLFPGSDALRAGAPKPWTEDLGRTLNTTIDKVKEVSARPHADDAGFATPNRYGVLSEPSLYEQVASAPITLPAGVANGVYRTAQDLANPVTAAFTGKPVAPTKSLLPEGNNWGAGLGEAAVEVPIHVTKNVMEGTADYINDARERGLTAATNRFLGTDRAENEIGNMWTGDTKAKMGSTYESGVEGLSQTIGTTADLLNRTYEGIIALGTGQFSVGRALGKGVDAALDRSVPNSKKADAITDLTKEIATGTVRSVARTVLDPLDSWEQGPVETAINISMIGAPIQAALKPLYRETVTMAAKGEALMARVNAAASKSDSLAVKVNRLKAEADDLVKQLESVDDLRRPDGNVVIKGTPELQKQAGDKIREWQDAATELANHDNDLALTMRSVHYTVARKLFSKVRSDQRYNALVKVAERAPSWALTFGVTAATDIIGIALARNIGKPGNGFKQWLVAARDNRVPEEFLEIEREVGSIARRDELHLQEAIRRLPADKAPKVREYLHMEHSIVDDMPIFRSGNDTSRNLVEWSDQQSAWRPTELGFQKMKENPKLAQQIEADLWTANRYGTDLARKSRDLTKEAIRMGMFADENTIRQLYWPSLMEGASFWKNYSSRQRLGPYLEAHALKTNELRRAGIPIEARELRHGMKTDLVDETMVGLARFGYDVQTYKMYEMASRRSSIAITEAEFKLLNEAEGKLKNIDVSIPPDVRARTVGLTDVEKRWISVPDRYRVGNAGAKEYGALSGMRVHESVWYEMANSRHMAETMHDWFPRLVSWWKGNVTVRSPKTHIRNTLSNGLLFAPMAGMSLLNPKNIPHYLEELNDLRKPIHLRSPAWREAYEAGVYQGSYSKTELVQGTEALVSKANGAFEVGLKDPIKNLVSGAFQTFVTAPKKVAVEGVKLAKGQRTLAKVEAGEAGKAAYEGLRDIWRGTGGWAWNTPGRIYGAEDDVFRGALYRKERAGGMSIKDASLKARRSYVDYENVPGYVSILRSPTSYINNAKGTPTSGAAAGFRFMVVNSPFIAFPVRAIPLVQEFMRTNPIEASMIIAMHDYMSDLGHAEAGLSREGIEAMRAALPSWERTGSEPVASYLPEYARDEDGKIRWLDVGYTSPYGSFMPTVDPDMNTTQNLVRGAAQIGLGSNPILKPIVDTFMPPKELRGRVDPTLYGLTDDETRSALLGNYGQAMLPPIMPSLTDVVYGDLGHGMRASGDYSTQSGDAPTSARLRGGKQYDKLAAADEGIPDWRGQVQTPAEARMSVFGGVGVSKHSEADIVYDQIMTLSQVLNDVRQVSQDAVGIESREAKMTSSQEKRYTDEYYVRARPMVERIRATLAKVGDAYDGGKKLPKDARRMYRYMTSKLDEILKTRRPDTFKGRLDHAMGLLIQELGKKRAEERAKSDKARGLDGSVGDVILKTFPER